MAKTKTDRRRKRRSPSSVEATSWAVIPLILSAGFILSFLLAFCSNEAQRFDDGVFPNPTNNNQQQQQQQRRFLLNEERVVDVGLEENTWHRQLRVRKQQGNNNNNNKRQLKAVAADSDGKIEGSDGQPMRRMALIPRYTDKHKFDECVGKTLEECQTLIDTFVTANPDQFNNQTTLMMDIRKIRELTDDSYYKVVIRTNLAGDKSLGIFDDGMIYYPWPWRVGGVDRTIGPWDCDVGTPLTVSECCQMIQQAVPDMDDNGHYMACFVEEPVGGPNNPEREDRAIVVTNANGKVVRPPVAH
mmetsp:Transcript_24867/g.53646  ORF Transcript_24867/g.53646 Transcript_24867/m.53646 type:complete len:301 (+) Transcript_24867:44-946(+)